MITWIRHWFILHKASKQYQKLVIKRGHSFDETFQKRVTYLAQMLNLQFGGEVTVSYQEGKTLVRRDGLVLMELTIFYIGTSIHVVARTNIEPSPRWWLGLAFAGMKWNATRFPAVKQLTYEKPRGP